MAGKRRAWSSKEQTKEESARLGTSVVLQLREECEAASNVGNTGAMYVDLRKLGRRGHRGTAGTTIISERIKAHFEKLTGERFENPREKKISVNEVMDICQELLALEANDLLNGEPDEEEIIREMKNVKESTLVRKNDIHQGIRR